MFLNLSVILFTGGMYPPSEMAKAADGNILLECILVQEFY